MTEEARPDLDLAQMEQQDADAYACQPQNPNEIATWKSIQDWGEKCDVLAADILAWRKGRPLDIDALLQADRADLEARDEYILQGATP
jgi:hypothetical protein